MEPCELSDKLDLVLAADRGPLKREPVPGNPTVLN